QRNRFDCKNSRRQSRLEMRLQKPKVLIDLPHNLGQKIRSALVSEFFGEADTASQLLSELRNVLGQSADVLGADGGTRVIVGNTGTPDNEPGRTHRDAAKSGYSFGNEIRLLFTMARDTVEQLVQRKELVSLHIPMGMLGLRLEIDGISQTQVQYIDNLRTDIFRNVNAAPEERGFGLTHGRHIHSP